MIIKELQNITSISIRCGSTEECCVECSTTVISKGDDFMVLHPNIEEENVQWLQGKAITVFLISGHWCYRSLVDEIHLTRDGKHGFVFKVYMNAVCSQYNRRRHVRYPLVRRCSVTALRTGLRCDGQTVDVSEDGIAINSDIMYSVNSVVKIVIKRADNSVGVLNATVMRSADGMIGCCLNEIPDWYAGAIEALRREYNNRVITGGLL